MSDFNPRKAAISDLLKELDDDEAAGFKKSQEPAVEPEVDGLEEAEPAAVAIGEDDKAQLQELLAKLGLV